MAAEATVTTGTGCARFLGWGRSVAHSTTVMAMKAALLVGDRSFEVTGDWPEPDVGPDDVLVDVLGVGLCGSDLAVWAGDWATPRRPWVLGHEAIGTVVDVGSNVSRARIGDPVAIEPNYPCGRCAQCRAGRTSLCPNRRVVAMNTPGLLCERAAVPSEFAWPVPPSVNQADLLCTEPFAVVHSAVELGGPASGDRVLVVGAGTQGLLLSLLLQSLGCQVYVEETQAGRQALAREFGATTDPVPSSSVGLVYETSGSVAGIRRSVEAVAGGGTVVVVGIPHSDEVPVAIPAVVRKQLHMVGAAIYDHPDGFQRTLELMASGRVHPGSILRHQFALHDVDKAFAAAGELPGKTWVSVSERTNP